MLVTRPLGLTSQLMLVILAHLARSARRARMLADEPLQLLLVVLTRWALRPQARVLRTR